MRRLSMSLFLLLVTPALCAAGWKKAYFGATPPGSWARYADTSPQMTMSTTMTRLADDAGSARVELKVEFANNQYPPVKNRYTLKPGFALDRGLVDYMSAVASGSIASGEMEPRALDAATIAAIVRTSPRYEPVVTFKGSESVGGNQADRYGYTLRHEGDPSTTETGDLWLTPAVPFGVVKQSSVTKDGKGKVTTTYERTLVASGTKTAGAAEAARSAKVVAPKKVSHTLAEAYDAGLVDVSVTIAAGSRNGERAHLVIERKNGEPLTLIVPKGRTSLRVDMPLEAFVFETATEKTFVLTGSIAAELDVKQLGDQRAMDGRFKISTYEGSPLYSGTATVGWVKH